MRQIRPSNNKKPSPSKYFEFFLNKYGPSCTSKATIIEIQSKLKLLYMDLMFGNLQQAKYFQYILGDERILEEALIDLKNKLLENMAYRDSLKFVAQNNDRQGSIQIQTNPAFNKCLLDSENKVFTYSTIYDGIIKFKQTGFLPDGNYAPEKCNPQFLLCISMQLNNNPFGRGAKSSIL